MTVLIVVESDVATGVAAVTVTVFEAVFVAIVRVTTSTSS